jgi:hypothetical protein
VDFLFYYVSSKYTCQKNATVESNNSSLHKKSKKQIQQVVKLKFLSLYYVIELTYDCNKMKGCKTKSHVHRQFDKLNIVPCKKNLECQYFKELSLNIPLNEDLDVLEKTTMLHKFLSQSL